MSGIVTIKEGVQFETIAPGGFVLLAAIHSAAKTLGVDLTITSGTDGMHSGFEDPHHRGEAYDVRTHDLPEYVRKQLVQLIEQETGPMFFTFLESEGTDNEHLHCQVAKGQRYPAEV